MNIIIAGAGDMGFHIAELLSSENQNITLIDKTEEILNHAQQNLDVLTIQGDSASFENLKNAGVSKANLVIAVTTSEKTNLMTAIMAKRMGAKQTIARVTSGEYILEKQRKLFHDMGVDTLISPTNLAAQEIKRLLEQCSLTDIFEFEEGKLAVIGLTLDDTSPVVNMALSEIDDRQEGVLFKPIAILRGNRTIIPNGNTILRRRDHLYLITTHADIEDMTAMVGKHQVKVKKVMIVGGTELALTTASMLENIYQVTLVVSDKERGKEMIEVLRNALVVNADPGDVNSLREEGLLEMDAFISLTSNSESNIITSLLASKNGIYKTIAEVDNINYIHLSQNMGVDTLINQKLIAANNIFRYVRKGNIKAIVTLHGVDAEVIEFAIESRGHRITRKPIKNLHFPKHALIGGVIRNNTGTIPTGDFQLQMGDKVIVFAQPDAIAALEKLFR